MIDLSEFKKKDSTNRIPLEINLRITKKNGKPCLEIRKVICDTEIIKQILLSAFNNYSIVVSPIFTSKVNAINSLIQKDIIYRDSGDMKYYFKI